MIKINTKTVLKNLKGETLKDGSGEEFTVGNTVCSILSANRDKPHRSYVMAKNFTEKEVELKAEDVVFLKSVIEKNELFTSLISGQLIEILEK